MASDYLHKHESDECFRGNLSDFKVGLHVFNPVFDSEVGTAIEVFDLALHTPSGTALCCLEGQTIDQNLPLRLLSMSLSRFFLPGSSSGRA